MAIRTIADLPQISIKEVRDSGLCANICNSLFEMSYMSAFGDYSTYQSRYVSYWDLSGMLLDDVIYQDYAFYGVKTLDNIRVLSSTSLSGQINVGRSNDTPTNKILINTGEIQATADSI